jgi:hypothetical protein
LLIRSTQYRGIQAAEVGSFVTIEVFTTSRRAKEERKQKERRKGRHTDGYTESCISSQ